MPACLYPSCHPCRHVIQPYFVTNLSLAYLPNFPFTEYSSYTVFVDCLPVVSTYSYGAILFDNQDRCPSVYVSLISMARTYTGEAIQVLGKVMVRIVKDEANVTLPLLVSKGGSTTLLGLELQKLKLDWKTIFSLHSSLSLQQVLLNFHIGQHP